MELNKIFFPAPKSSYNAQQLKKKIIWIPKRKYLDENQMQIYNNQKMNQQLPLSNTHNKAQQQKQLHKKSVSLNDYQFRKFQKKNISSGQISQQNKQTNINLQGNNLNCQINNNNSFFNSEHETQSNTTSNNSDFNNCNNSSQSFSIQNQNQKDLENILQDSKQILNQKNLQFNSNKQKINTNDNKDIDLQNIAKKGCHKRLNSNPDQYLQMLSTRINFKSPPKALFGSLTMRGDVDPLSQYNILKNNENSDKKDNNPIEMQEHLGIISDSGRFLHESFDDKSKLAEQLFVQSGCDLNQLKNQQLQIGTTPVNNQARHGSQKIKLDRSRANSFITIDDNTNVQDSPINLNKNSLQQNFIEHQLKLKDNKLIENKQDSINNIENKSFISKEQFNDVEENVGNITERQQGIGNKPIQMGNKYKTRQIQKTVFKQKGDLDEFDCYEVKGINTFRSNHTNKNYNFVTPSLMQSINQINSNFTSPRYNKYFNFNSNEKNKQTDNSQLIQSTQTQTNMQFNTVYTEDNYFLEEDEMGIDLNNTKPFIQQQSQSLCFKKNKINVQKYEIEGYIPCLLMKAEQPTPYILVYFHGNGEDINHSWELLDHLRINLNINILAMEYPGYGIYEGDASHDKIEKDAQDLYKYLRCNMKMQAKNIILLGRSIGSGAATYLASKYKVGCLVLVSPFTSIRGVVQHLLGKFVSMLVKERFNNLERIKDVKSPILFVHGKKDKLVPYQHSEELQEQCRSSNQINIPENMNHTEFDFTEDLSIPIYNFLYQNGIDLDLEDLDLEEMVYPCFPNEIFEVPQKNNK